jgi:hypothetical protein
VGREERRLLLGCGDNEAAPPLYIQPGGLERGAEEEGDGGKQRRGGRKGWEPCLLLG